MDKKMTWTPKKRSKIFEEMASVIAALLDAEVRGTMEEVRRRREAADLLGRIGYPGFGK